MILMSTTTFRHMKASSVILDLSLVYEVVLRLDPEKPDQLEEDIRRLMDLLNDLSALLSRHS